MRFDFAEAQEAFRREVRAFAARKLAPYYQHDDRAAKLRPELLGDLGAMGLMGLRVPEAYGGQAADCVTTGVACEEIARADFNAAYLPLNADLVSEIVEASGTEAQKAAFLGHIATGEELPALFLTEHDHGSEAAALELRV